MQSTSTLPQPHRDLSALNWDMLRIFLAVSRSQSISKAAKNLAESQPTISRRIRELEDCLAARLIARGKDGVKLTEEGRVLLEYVEKIESETFLLTDAVNGADARYEGDVILTAPSSLGLNLIAPNLAGFSASYPSITLDLILNSSKLNLMDREADVSVRIGTPSQQSLVGRRLGSVKFFLYASESYLERFGRPESLEDLQAHRFVDLSGELETSCQSQILANIAPAARRVIKTNCMSTQFQAVSDGMGIGMLPDYQVNYQVRTGSPIVQLLPEIVTAKEQVWVLFHPDLKAVARARAVIDFIIDVTKVDLAD
ncbi:LysR family transcriptional regulator [Pelagibius sp. Alg239-R121]|uniref:LysR family transcriptional regulator n=1 Tax=Pelagibius sp. Alg239-R121 TaxID=2993448 RepID=UPI0024A61B1F|nr:LysR family transcriptional regulator [Pelagibius sp. Alg239-R121]